MRKCIIIDVELLENRKLERLLEKLTNKYGSCVKVYQSGDEKELCSMALDLHPYSDWSEISAKIKSKYLKNSGGV